MAFFDGHLHSTCSDGALSPEDLVDAVAAAGTRVMALTDHDTFSGHARAARRCEQRALGFVPGVELSVELEGRELHVLAYFVGPEHTALAQALAASLAARRAHLAGALAKLAGLGLVLSEAEVLAEVRDESVGRPHIARALVKKGYVPSVEEAFRRFLGDGKPGHLPRQHVAAAHMIGLVNAVAGVCSVAHPGIYSLGERELDLLANMGLKGLEVYHPEHGPSDVVFYLRQCERFGLVPTGGNDFHAAADKPHVRLGTMGLDEAGFRRLEAARGAGHRFNDGGRD